MYEIVEEVKKRKIQEDGMCPRQMSTDVGMAVCVEVGDIIAEDTSMVEKEKLFQPYQCN